MNIIRSIRKLRLIQKIILSKRSRLLLKFSRANLIESSNSSSDSDDNKYDTLKLMEDKNNIIKLGAAIKLKRSLNFYTKNSMDDNEKNLIRGIFIRKPQENIEEDRKSSSHHNTYKETNIHNYDGMSSNTMMGLDMTG